MDQASSLYITFSLVGIIAALIGMSAVYRSTRPQIGGSVIVSNWTEERRAISVSRYHLGLEHQGKSPLILFYADDKKPILRQALQITIEKGDGKYTFAGSEQSAAPGGGICVDTKTYNELKRALGDRDINVTPISLRMKYPSAANLAFLLREHPDLAVRASAWVFLLTSLFGLLQWILAKKLGV